MIVEQLYTKCLAQGAYFVASNGEAAIIDPLREVQPYLDLAQENKTSIKYIFLTHFHADFVSGQVDLAKATGATIVFGPQAHPAYKHYSAKDGEVFKIGDITLEVLHTPGHTMESSCYLLRTPEGKQEALFTGDTLFIGDVGRPDLAAKSDLSTQDLAGFLYDSLHNKIAPLDNNIIVYPAHGAGSACGKNMSSETSDTLGNQKETNYAFKLKRKDFIKELVHGLALPPSYFPENVAMNKKENLDFDRIIERGTRALSVQEFDELSRQEDVLVLDTRSNNAFAKASLPQSIFIGLHGQFAPWVGAVIPDINQKIIFLSEAGKEAEVVTRLARVGYDHSLGYLQGGIEAWEGAGKETTPLQEINAQDFVDGITNGSVINPIDVRKDAEYNASHIEAIAHCALNEVHTNIKTLSPRETYHVHCAGGYRSLIYASIARKYGIENVVNVQGGYAAIKKTKLGTLKLTS